MCIKQKVRVVLYQFIVFQNRTLFIFRVMDFHRDVHTFCVKQLLKCPLMIPF